MAVTFLRPTAVFRHELKSSRDARSTPEATSTEAAECWGRGRLTFDQNSEVEAAQFRYEIVFDPNKGEFVEKRFISVPKMGQALLWAWCGDGKFGCNWVDENGHTINRPTQINEVVDKDDLNDLRNALLRHHYPEYFGSEDVEVDQGGNPIQPKDDEADPTSDSSTSGGSSSSSSPAVREGSRSAPTGSSKKS